MTTLKDIKLIRDLHRSLIKTQADYKRARLELRKIIKERRACKNAGYLQHYPEYSSMISECISRCKVLKKQLTVTANSLNKQLYS